MSSAQSYDLLVVTDATASMGEYLQSLQHSIPEILALARLSGSFRRVGVLAYRDYSEPEPERVVWSGWNAADLPKFVQNLDPSGGGDFAEAAKTALIRALEYIEKESKTLVLWYADAPPHHCSYVSYNNDVLERKAFPSGATDWVQLCYQAKDAHCTVLSFVPSGMQPPFASFYTLLSDLTGGLLIKSRVTNVAERIISRLTLDVIMQWLGQPSEGSEATFSKAQASALHFKEDPNRLKVRMKDESAGSNGFLPPPLKTAGIMAKIYPLRVMDQVDLQGNIPKSSLADHPINFAQRYLREAEDRDAYQQVVYESLKEIINHNVAALTYNAVFGQLWRAVCRGTGDHKIELVNAFSLQVGNISDPNEKKEMNIWLENSFDATEEINRICAGVEGDRIYLDLDTDIDLTRTELLEVSKSCYSGVLKKITSIFTHLKIVEPGVTLAPEQRSLPLNLPGKELFRVLPHLVVSGTLYPARAASIVAILAVITNVSFLREQAIKHLKPTKGTWINMEIPENISFEVAKLLLKAPEEIVLNDKERKFYTAVRRYRLLELNIDSTIHAKVGWIPKKTRAVGDRKQLCKTCGHKRSVTIMSHERKDVCGLCQWYSSLGSKDKKAVPKLPKDMPGVEEMQSCWVQCSIDHCRAHYVVENVDCLAIRPKCYYCRIDTKCPFVECTKCTNRVIIPEFYRAAEDNKSSFLCFGCSATPPYATIANMETSIRTLGAENGFSWLRLKDKDPDTLSGKSIFKIFQAHPPEFLDTGLAKTPIKITLGHKAILNVEELLQAIDDRVGSGQVELGTCSLCFSDQSKAQLRVPCGRRGCTSNRVDDSCLQEWYGKSKPGEVLRLMELVCPFCRRVPARRVLAKFNPQAAALIGVSEALADRQWIYAWCMLCGTAKRAQERACCDGDRVPAFDNFVCQECLPPPVVIEHNIKSHELAVKITFCPKCNTPVEKIDGCNHITCRCGQHFCFVCGASKDFQSAQEVYSHIAQAHGGYWDELGSDDEEE